MSLSVILILSGFIIVVVGGLLSIKFKNDNRKMWWLPLVIGGSLFILFIAFLIWAMIDFMSTLLCV